MKLDKNTAIIIGTTMTIEFFADSMIHSLAASKGGPFKFQFPKGKELVKLLALGFIGGLVLDLTVKAIQQSLKSQAEKDIEALIEEERKKLTEAGISGKTPQIVWG